MKRKHGFSSLPQAEEGSRVSSARHTLWLERYSGTWVRNVLQYTTSRVKNAARKNPGGMSSASINISAGANNNWIGSHQRASPARRLSDAASRPHSNAKASGEGCRPERWALSRVSANAVNCSSAAVMEGGSFLNKEVLA